MNTPRLVLAAIGALSLAACSYEEHRVVREEPVVKERTVVREQEPAVVERRETVIERQP